ncbi:MAG: sulfite exporter TauE/SafE family protein [Thermomicrobiaceae bacterium]|nr:sulfite exporter TauE/SafE family protein [Thermomicrobiaceae bacterium]
MHLVELLGLGLAGFVAGGVNAGAGGGSLISFPALLAAGYPSIQANVTNTVAIWPGTVGGSFAYRKELEGQGERIVLLGLTSVVGALVGSALLLASSEDLFSRLVPFLILFACALLASQNRLGRWVQRHRGLGQRGHRSYIVIVAQFLAAIYGAYFGAGLGIMMLAFLGIFLADHLQRINALKGLLAMVINGVAVVYFAFLGNVAWPAAGLMAITSVLGGYFGVRVARRLSATALRTLVLVYGVTVALKLLFFP